MATAHSAWVRSARQGNLDPYRYRAACTCGWVGPVRDTAAEALPDREEHERGHAS